MKCIMRIAQTWDRPEQPKYGRERIYRKTTSSVSQSFEMGEQRGVVCGSLDKKKNEEGENPIGDGE